MDRGGIGSRRTGSAWWCSKCGEVYHGAELREAEDQRGLVVVEDLVRLLEQTLPRTFGGGATDDQLVEHEAVIVKGTPRVRSVPREAVAAAFQTALRDTGHPIDRLWHDVRWLDIERWPPYETDHRKIDPVHRPAVVGVRPPPGTSR